MQRAKLIVSMIDDNTLTAAQAAKQAGFKLFPVRVGSNVSTQMVSKALLINRRVVNAYSFNGRSQLIDLALQKPRSLGYPFEMWTLVRLQTAFKEKKIFIFLIQRSGNGSKRRVCWKRQQSWFHRKTGRSVC